MYAHVEGYGSSDKCIVLIVHRRYVEFKELWGLYLLLLSTVSLNPRKRGRKISSNREIPEMACRAMTESIKNNCVFFALQAETCFFLPPFIYCRNVLPIGGSVVKGHPVIPLSASFHL